VVERGPEKAGVGGSIPSLAIPPNPSVYAPFVHDKSVLQEKCWTSGGSAGAKTPSGKKTSSTAMSLVVISKRLKCFSTIASILQLRLESGPGLYCVQCPSLTLGIGGSHA
jgi:hypothetical protein